MHTHLGLAIVAYEGLWSSLSLNLMHSSFTQRSRNLGSCLTRVTLHLINYTKQKNYGKNNVIKAYTMKHKLRSHKHNEELKIIRIVGLVCTLLLRLLELKQLDVRDTETSLSTTGE